MFNLFGNPKVLVSNNAKIVESSVAVQMNTDVQQNGVSVQKTIVELLNHEIHLFSIKNY